MNWLSQISPDTVFAVASLLFSFGAWGWKKLRGEKVASFDDLLRGLGKQAIHVLLTDPSVTTLIDPDALKARANAVLWTLATKAGIPRNAMTEAIAGTIIEHIVGDVLAELRALDTKTATNLDTIAKSAGATLQVLRTLKPDLPFDGPVIVQPDGSLKPEKP